MLIEIQDLEKVYHDHGIPVHALHTITMDIEEGEFSAIVGPSGSGKTTLLNMIGGLDVPSRGNITLAGTPIASMSQRDLANFRRDNIGFIFQNFNLIPVLTVAENIEYVMVLQDVPAKERRERVASILYDVGLEGMEDRLPNNLSGGQQQRVAIARAMVAKPRIILADEPTANIDSHTGVELVDLMHHLNEEHGMTFIFSTHDRMIRDRAKRVIKLRDGKIVEEEKR
jgi:putative ABC transport system ATP-binding protein